MLGVQYDPPNHKFAIYTPLFLPIFVPLFASILARYKKFKARRAKPTAAVAAAAAATTTAANKAKSE
jgi:hypothetical protein